MHVHSLFVYAIANYRNLIAYAIAQVDYIHLFSLAIQYLEAFQGTYAFKQW